MAIKSFQDFSLEHGFGVLVSVPFETKDQALKYCVFCLAQGCNTSYAFVGDTWCVFEVIENKN